MGKGQNLFPFAFLITYKSIFVKAKVNLKIKVNLKTKANVKANLNFKIKLKWLQLKNWNH